MIGSDVASNIYAQVVQGASKESSAYVTDDETAAFWDQVQSEIGSDLTGKGYILDVPSDVGPPLEDLGIDAAKMAEYQRIHDERRAAGGAPAPAQAPAVTPDGGADDE